MIVINNNYLKSALMDAGARNSINRVRNRSWSVSAADRPNSLANVSIDSIKAIKGKSIDWKLEGESDETIETYRTKTVLSEFVHKKNVWRVNFRLNCRNATRSKPTELTVDLFEV
jgi:hypothetical protein